MPDKTFLYWESIGKYLPRVRVYYKGNELIYKRIIYKNYNSGVTILIKPQIDLENKPSL